MTWLRDESKIIVKINMKWIKIIHTNNNEIDFIKIKTVLGIIYKSILVRNINKEKT